MVDQKRHPKRRSNGRAMWCLLWIFVRKSTQYSSTALYIGSRKKTFLELVRNYSTHLRYRDTHSLVQGCSIRRQQIDGNLQYYDMFITNAFGMPQSYIWSSMEPYGKMVTKVIIWLSTKGTKVCILRKPGTSTSRPVTSPLTSCGCTFNYHWQ